MGKLEAPNKAGIKVFISSRESKCEECGEDLGRGAYITLKEEKGALCLSCGDLDHLVFLPTGDACVSRRAKKNSSLWAVILKWSRARKRYERQGLLVTEEGLRQAEEACLADADARERRRLWDGIICSFSGAKKVSVPNQVGQMPGLFLQHLFILDQRFF